MIDLGYNRKLILEDGEEYRGFAFGYTSLFRAVAGLCGHQNAPLSL